MENGPKDDKEKNVSMANKVDKSKVLLNRSNL